MTRAGLIRAEGQVVTSAASTDRVVIQKLDSNSGQFEPREITVGNLLTGGGTSFTAGSVLFAGAGGDLAEDNTNLNFNDGTNVLTVGSDVTSTGGNFIASTAGKGLQIKTGSNARIGQATLVSGTVTVANTSVTANTRIFVSRNSAGVSTAVGTLTLGTITPNTSFVITALNPTNATTQTNDVSVVNWMLVESIA